jgi:hypothetical protein
VEPKRPLGITILSIITFAVGCWYLFLVMFALTFTSSMVMITAFSGVPPEYGPAYAIMQNLGLVLLAGAGAAALTIGGAGLWALQRWAYWMAVAGAGLSLITHVVPAFQGFLNGTSMISGLLAALILVYLFLPSVRRAFFPASGDMTARPA